MEQPLKSNELAPPVDNSSAFLGKQDPILQELWAVKAQLNKDAHYSVKERSKQVRGLNWATARARLGMT
jgi:hypothetical protein